jgi:hypothetical protein
VPALASAPHRAFALPGSVIWCGRVWVAQEVFNAGVAREWTKSSRQAIKAIRDGTSCTLEEAKRIADQLESANNPRRRPPV